MNTLNELERAYNHYKNDPQFQRELTNLLQEYGGGHILVILGPKADQEARWGFLRFI